MKNQTLSVIVPVFNEEENVVPLYHELKGVLLDLLKRKTISSYQIVFVNDGSRDRTQSLLESLRNNEKHLKIIEFRKNFGQTAALKAGFTHTTGDLIVTMDGDMQNDPRDIPRLIARLNEGYDVVSGWRFNRRDTMGKRLSSKTMNILRKKLVGDSLHDYGCSLKIYRRECIKDLQLFGELHRYITAYLYIRGYRIAELKVNHRPRFKGKTKYNLKRGLNGIFDLFYLKFWASYSTRPLHFFGRLGLYQWILSLIIVMEQIIKAIIINELRFGPLLSLASMLVVTGLLFIIFGFVFEIMSRLYFKEEEIYSIRKIL